MSDREPIEPPGGFEPKAKPDAAPEARPDWLTGADDGIDFGSRPHEVERPALRRPGGEAPSGGPRPPLRLTVPPAAAAAAPEQLAEPSTEAWAPAASSIPKLSVVPQRERPTVEVGDSDLETPVNALGEAEDLEGGSGPGEGAEGEAPLAAPEEPWWLVALDTLATNRLLQIGIAALLAALLAWTFWPRKENQTTPIAAIKQHPQRFEGQAVRIRGEVGEVFDVGSGVVFELHQRRDTLVVFSPSRRPALHDHVVVQGTVSTGYLDGTPRVALFEAPGAPAR